MKEAVKSTPRKRRGLRIYRGNYYPFGLVMAGISSKALNALSENRKKYNGIEQANEFDLNMYDAFYRNLDPQIGRWFQIDRMTDILESYSPYESMGNNPITNEDPLGDFRTRFGAWIHKIFNGGGEVGENKDGEWFVRKTETSFSEEGGPTVTAKVTYGEGRNRYTAKRERLVGQSNDQRVIDDLTRAGIWDPSVTESQARNNTLLLSVNSVLPNAILKPATVAVNTTKTIDNAAKIPVGRSGSHIRIITKNVPTVINGRKFTGHALDKMQSGGILSPTAVINVIENSARSFPGNLPGTTIYIRDNLKVVTNMLGDVISVMYQ